MKHTHKNWAFLGTMKRQTPFSGQLLIQMAIFFFNFKNSSSKRGSLLKEASWRSIYITLEELYFKKGFAFFVLQLHFVSYNTKYASLSEAVSKPDGLAVLGLLIEVYFLCIFNK